MPCSHIKHHVFYLARFIVLGGRQSSDSFQHFRIHRLCPPRRPESPLPKRPQSPTFQLAILSIILQILGLFSSAFVALISLLSSPSHHSPGAQVLSVLLYLPPHRRYCGWFQITLDMVQPQPPSVASATAFRRTLLQADLALEWSPRVA